jgi:hypothetical protein
LAHELAAVSWNSPDVRKRTFNRQRLEIMRHTGIVLRHFSFARMAGPFRPDAEGLVFGNQ